MNPAGRVGRRYPLLLYTRMLDRWWPALLLIGLGMLALAWPFHSDLYVRLTEPWRWRILAGVGALVIGASFLMLLLRKSAYIQPFPDHLKLATPLFRLNISYRRMSRTTTAAMSILFPPRSLHGLKRDILEPFFGSTAIVLELNALPIPVSALRLFLSPFFFKDRTPHLVILVTDWMRFSTEMQSMKAGAAAYEPPARRGPTSILTRLPRK